MRAKSEVIKGWLDANGETHELIYDVACTDDRAIANRRCDRVVGSTVDVADASYTNTIGDPLLTAFFNTEETESGEKVGYLAEFDETETIFESARHQVTRDYVSGRFG